MVFNQISTPLQYTPRSLLIHPPTNNLLLIETDHNAFTEATKLHRKQQMAEEMVQSAGEDEQIAAAQAAEAFLAEDLPENIFGAPKAGSGMWASCLRIMHPSQGRTLDLVQFEQNEAAFRYTMLVIVIMTKSITNNTNYNKVNNINTEDNFTFTCCMYSSIHFEYETLLLCTIVYCSSIVYYCVLLCIAHLLCAVMYCLFLVYCL